MIASRWIGLFMLVTLMLTSHASARDGITLLHYEPVERLVIQSQDGGDPQMPGGQGPVLLSFDALGRNFDLELEPNSSLLAAIPGSVRSEVGVPYRGRLAGNTDSWARIVVADGTLSGLIWDGTGLIGIEPPGRNLAGSSETVIFRLADVIIEPGALSCASGGSMPKTGDAVFKAIVGDIGVSTAPGAFDELTIGVVADTEAVAIHGTDTQAEIVTRFNNVDGIYSQQINVQITPQIEVFTDATDPLDTPADAVTGETNTNALLTELQSYRAGDGAQRALGLTHLYTGRDLEGTTAGVAFVGVVCNANAGVGLSEISNRPVIDALVAAHEIGHNFNANHDGDPGGSCPSAPTNHIMAPSVNPNNDTFSACSVAVMQTTAAAAQCITPLLDHDVSVEFNAPDSTVLLSNDFQVGLDIVNRGIQDVTGIVADISLPSNVSFVDATGANCVETAGTVSCSIGTIAAGGMTSLNVSTDSVAVGSGSFTASISADADDRAGNDQDSVQLTVDPAVNLVINTPATAQVEIDQSTSVSVSIENTSTLDATNLTLNISLNAALQANSATWSIGTCTVAAQQVDCQANQLAAQSTSNLSLNVTGLDTGTKGYTVTLTSSEVDADTSDNSLTASVRVNEPAKDDGGSMSWLLLVLGYAVIARMRRQRSIRSLR